jgi:PKHD-type hydroxylase
MSIDCLNDWFIFDGVLDKKICNKIKKLGEGNWGQSGVFNIGKSTPEGNWLKNKPKQDSKIRVSDVYWTSEQWIYDLIFPLMHKANKLAGWNLDIDAAEDMQITRYKKGGFYTSHKDGMADSLSAYDIPNNPFMHGKVRKISMSIVLNDNFEGGDFEFISHYFRTEKGISIDTFKPKAGQIIFFLSGVEHRVAPVTKGTRYSLVSWFLGAPIK